MLMAHTFFGKFQTLSDKYYQYIGVEFLATFDLAAFFQYLKLVILYFDQILKYL